MVRKLKFFTTIIQASVGVFFTMVAIASDIDDHFFECADEYEEQSFSEYVLPYSIGQSYLVGQGNCTDGSHESGSGQAYAYDFDMLVGTPVVASRGGEVIEVQERFIDDNETSGQENYVLVLHDDDTVAGYYHLTEDGSLVAVGDRVTQGDVIALSGNTGDSSEAHLHFEVLECFECDTIPISFFNARYHDHGLAEDEDYQAR
jgi:hypothetical protein